jgi:hypothetical protein
LLESADWIFRLTDKRIVQVKTKNMSVQKIAVLDVLTNLMFAVEAPEEFDFEVVETGKEYLFSLKVYTSKKVEDVDAEFLGFFEAADVNQKIEDFIKAYWVYPAKIRFDLTEVEEA